MKKIKYLFNRIDKHIDEISSVDFHNLISTLLTSAQYGRLFRCMESEEKIQEYFNCNPEVYEYIKDYSPMRLLRFLERIINNNLTLASQKPI